MDLDEVDAAAHERFHVGWLLWQAFAQEKKEGPSAAPKGREHSPLKQPPKKLIKDYVISIIFINIYIITVLHTFQYIFNLLLYKQIVNHFKKFID